MWHFACPLSNFNKFLGLYTTNYTPSANDTMSIFNGIVEEYIGFDELSKYAENLAEIKNTSGRQEMLESILNNYILEAK